MEGNAGSGGDAAAEPEPQAAAEEAVVDPSRAAATVDENSVAAGRESTSGPAAAMPRRPRASDNPILGMPFEQYLSVVEQLAAAVLARRSGDGAGGVLASECPEAVATLEAHGINGEACLVFLEHLQTRCRRAFGGASRMEARAREAGQRWFQGLGFCREIFVERPEAGTDDT